MANNNNYIVYCHRNKMDGKVYIGVTSRGLDKRAGSGGKMYKSSPLFYAAITKYGWDSFDHEVVAEGLSIADAAKLEQELISKYNSTDPAFGYNLQCGGFPSSEQRRAYESATRVDRIRTTLKAQRSDPEYRAVMRSRMLEVWSRPEHRERIAAARANSNNPAGRKPIAVKITPGDVVLKSKNATCRYLRVSQAHPRVQVLKHDGDTSIIKVNDVEYHLTVVDPNKESELLECPQMELF